MATAKLYGRLFNSLANKEIDFDSDSFKVMLTTSAYTPDQDTHQYKSSVTNELANGNGYTTGGAALAVTVSYDAATNTYKLLASGPTSWADSSITARRAVVYDDTPATDATKPLIGWVDFETDITSIAAALTINWDADGVVNVTVAA